MTRPLTITKEIHFGSGKRGRKVMRTGAEEKAPNPGRIPRVSRLMALAIRMDELVRAGQVADYAELSRLAHVTRARMTQIMNLLHLAPEIQEEILELPWVMGGREPINETMLRPVVAIPDWRKQRAAWSTLKQRFPMKHDLARP